MSELDRVAELLAQRFEQPGEHGRIVFWEDTHGQYTDAAATLVGLQATHSTLQHVTMVEIGHTPFNLRYHMIRQEPNSKFLVYMNGEQPAPEDDWLYDLKLAYGPFFSADKITMIATEIFPRTTSQRMDEWIHTMRQYPKFFDSNDRVERLRKRLTPDDDAVVFQAKMVAVLLRLKEGRHSLQDIWRALLAQYANHDDSGMKSIENMGLAEYHWNGTRTIYHFDMPDGSQPSVNDFVLWLFTLAWNGFIDDEHPSPYYGDIKRDYDQWSTDRTFTQTMRELSTIAEIDLHIGERIGQMTIQELAAHDIFSEVDEVLIRKLIDALHTHSMPDREIQELIAQRQQFLWFDTYKNQYQAIAAASTLHREIEQASAQLSAMSSPSAGITLYANNLFRVDQAYRKFTHAWMTVGEPEWSIVQQLYDNEYEQYQRALGKQWQQQIDTLHEWKFSSHDGTDEGIPQQQDFFVNDVKPRIQNGHKIAVIISDALRYEVGEEFTRVMNAENRYHATIQPRVSMLPSYTQLGMAALLPHSSLTLQGKDYSLVAVDDKSTVGTSNRNAIVQQHSGRAIDWNTLKNASISEARELVKSCQFIYVYHNAIDAVGDKYASENQTFTACETAIEELQTIVKKLASANITNMIVTADHGFLYQNRGVIEADFIDTKPRGDEIWKDTSRFVIGRNLVPDESMITFTAAQLGLDNNPSEGVTVQIPNSILRFRGGGAGTRFVHGGASLPEIVIPVVHINKGRTVLDDTRPVAFRILQKSDRITSGQITVEFVQDEAVGGKIQPIELAYVGLWASRNGHDVLISNETPLAFDSTDPDIARRHSSAVLVLTSEAQQFNGSTIELRLRVPSSSVYASPHFLDMRAQYGLNRGVIADDGFDF